MHRRTIAPFLRNVVKFVTIRFHSMELQGPQDVSPCKAIPKTPVPCSLRSELGTSISCQFTRTFMRWISCRITRLLVSWILAEFSCLSNLLWAFTLWRTPLWSRYCVSSKDWLEFIDHSNSELSLASKIDEGTKMLACRNYFFDGIHLEDSKTRNDL